MPGPVQTDGAGTWSQTGFTPGTYTVTPVRQGFSFNPPSRTFSASQSNLTFVATPDVACTTTPIASGQTIAGALTTGDCLSPLRPGAFADRYTFSGTAAQQVAIPWARPPSTRSCSSWGRAARWSRSTTTVAATISSRIPPATGFFTLPADGTYTIEATSYAGTPPAPTR